MVEIALAVSLGRALVNAISPASKFPSAWVILTAMPALDLPAKHALIREAISRRLGRSASGSQDTGSGHLSHLEPSLAWAGPSVMGPSPGEERFAFAGELYLESEFGGRCSWYFGEITVAADGTFEATVAEHPDSGMNVFAMSNEESLEIDLELARIRNQLALHFKP